MEKKQEAEQAWRRFWLYDRRSKDKPEYLMGIEDFKLALKAEIEKEISKTESCNSFSESYKEAKNNGLRMSLSLIDEVKPIQK